MMHVVQMLMVGVLMASAGLAAAQQVYPNKPIRIITPFPPGGSSDPLARLVGQKLTESWGQQVIVENRPGGNTIIGTEAVARSAPDGYTLLMMSTTHITTALLIPTPYDAIRDFAAVATLASGDIILVLHPSVPAANVQEFITLARSRPGQLNYASGGTGGVNHLAGEFFNIMAGVKMQHIPYKGGGPAMTDLIAGQVQLSFQPPIAVVSHIKNGKLKAIAVAGEARLPALPQVATFTQAGMPGFDVKLWIGVLAPAGTPKAVVDKLSAELGRMLALPDTRERLVEQGMVPYISTADQFAALMKAETAKYGKVIKTANIKLEN